MSDNKERRTQEEEWYEYDENGNRTYFKNSNGFETWCKYNKDGNLIHRIAVI